MCDSSWRHEHSRSDLASVAGSEACTVARRRDRNSRDGGAAALEEVRRQEALRCVLELPGRGARTRCSAGACRNTAQRELV
jgi:hypothetical protein